MLMGCLSVILAGYYICHMFREGTSLFPMDFLQKACHDNNLGTITSMKGTISQQKTMIKRMVET
jgi:hypothetical protein